MFTHSIRGVERAREVRAAWRAPLLLDAEGTGNGTGRWDLQSLFSADVLKKCALIALQVIAEEGRDGDGFQVTALGPNEGETWSEDEDASSTASREGNVCNDALHVVGLHW